MSNYLSRRCNGLDCILDYQERFNGKTCQVSTNYKYLEIFKVNFCLTDLHHLFGLHKITRDYASQTKPAIQAGVFILEISYCTMM
ncbi:hypothetical protein JIX91_00635 [Streptococcus pneumoniae]|uniref:hypothetical protein n=1 Tax=Streptococcus pneumoniae TaxID=1313 RepID=UPI001916C3A2|nr:hypothetical protein [Streptococcus pneumoniae]QQP73282.1 hypothetical protein JIX91_00635 [Streptococcus pneumoniae]